MNNRIQQLDFLKSICILLMVIFHLVYIGDKYPYAKEVVYTFHMPIFLLISGYLTRTDRPALRFFKTQLWIFIPYLLLELPYVALSGIAGVRGADTDLSVQHLLYRVFVDPLGPYWYLHTLIICNITLWSVQHFLKRLNDLARVIIFAALLAVWVYGLGIVADNVLYYFFGAVIGQMGVHFFQVFRPSFLALLLGAWLCGYPANLHYLSPGGVAITYFVINFLLWAYERLGEKVLQPALFIGRNTLAIFLFSPIFTMAVKPLVPVLSFDPTGMIFLVLGTSSAVAGSLAIAWTMDRLKLSRWFCGHTKMIN